MKDAEMKFEELNLLEDKYNDQDRINEVYHSIIQSSYDGIYVSDCYGNGVLVNQAYSRITGVPPQDLMGKNMKNVVEEGIVSESVTFKVLNEKKPTTIIQHVKGKEVLVTGNPVLDENGEIAYVVTNVRDISDLNQLKLELKRSKQLMKKYLNEIDDLKKKEILHLHMDGIVAHDKEIVKVIKLAQKVGKVNTTVLLLGESGVGKEVIVKLIQQTSDRKDKPLIKVNCAAIPEHLLESELFGYEKGAFTGADSRGKAGLFEQANGGTIFLDEIGDMPLNLQAKLLRVLQEFEITRVGGRKTVNVDVRVVSATNMDLEKMVEQGKFRQDLYYRLNIVPIKIPPLRERKADIAPLSYFFLNKTNNRYQFSKRFHPEVIQFFEQYSWPGNIREMENLIERLVVTSDDEEIRIDDIPTHILEEGGAPVKQERTKLKDIVENVERRVIQETMDEFKTTRKAAGALGISQSALVKKMKRYGM